MQARVKEFAPKAVYVHCYVHTLNLVLVDSVCNVQLAVESLYVFISTTKAHTIFVEKQKAVVTSKFIDCSACPIPDGHVVIMLLMLSVVHTWQYWTH